MKQPLSTYAIQALQHAADMEISNQSRPVDIQIAIAKRFERFAQEWEYVLQGLLDKHCTVRVNPLRFIDPTMREIFDSLDKENGALVAKNGAASVGQGYDLIVHFYPLYVQFGGKVYMLPERQKEMVIPFQKTDYPILDASSAPFPSITIETIGIRALAFGVGYPLMDMKPEQKLIDSITFYAVDWMNSGKAQEEIK